MLLLVEDTITYSDELTISVFQLKGLTELYQKQMILRGAATKDTKYVYATRLINSLLFM